MKSNSFVYLSSLRLVVQYPDLDVYNKWLPLVENTNREKLKQGIISGDNLITTGISGYKFCICKHDARINFSDRVTQKVGIRDSAGILITLGEKFLIDHHSDLQWAVDELLHSVGASADNPIKIKQIGLSIDILGFPLKSLNQFDFTLGWVGRSKMSKLEFNSVTNDLERVLIGSQGQSLKEQSPIILRMFDKVAHIAKSGDMFYWLDIWKDFDGPVTCLEWQVKPFDGNFEDDLKQFDLFSGFGIRKLLVYLLDWGRLSIPDSADSNNRRWEETEFWKRVRKAADRWLNGCDIPVSRLGKEFHGVGLDFVKYISGALSSGIAKFGYKKDELTVDVIWEGLLQYGISKEKILNDAKEKAEKLRRM